MNKDSIKFYFKSVQKAKKESTDIHSTPDLDTREALETTMDEQQELPPDQPNTTSDVSIQIKPLSALPNC